MLYSLLSPLFNEITLLNVFRYVTFRAACAGLSSFFLFLLVAPRFIALLKRQQKEGQPIRLDGPATHLQTKKGTPTMGGVLIMGVLATSVLLWAKLSNPYIWIALLVTLSFGFLGALDDYAKLTKKSSAGISARVKFLCQILIAVVAVLLLNWHTHSDISTIVTVPFAKSLVFDIGYFYIPFTFCVLVGSANAVNLTDGLDGLAIVPVVMCAGCFVVISYVVGNAVFSDYLKIYYIPGCEEVTVFCAALIGAGLGFLWYNAYPAQMFMGDTGSLSLGGALGTVALLTKHEFVLVIVGGIFVVETVSVVLQVASYKLRKKRIFLMAPLHHHFEKLGWSETQVVVRFWVVSAILAILGLMTLKIR